MLRACIQQFQHPDAAYPFLHTGFAPIRADENFYATALNAYQAIQVPQNQSQFLLNRECTSCGRIYDHELEKDDRGCSICQTCQNNALVANSAQSGGQLVGRSLSHQNETGGLESVYKLYTANAEEHMLKDGVSGSSKSDAASSSINTSLSSSSQKTRNKKPPVRLRYLTVCLFKFCSKCPRDGLYLNRVKY